MKLIDSQGKLFGRINALDAAVVAGLLVFVFVIVIAKLAPNRSRLELKRLPPDEFYQVDILLDRDQAWLAGRITVGDAEFDLDGDKAYEVTGVRREEIAGYGEATIITIRSAVAYDPAVSGEHGRRPLVPGRRFHLTLDACETTGTVYSMKKITR